MRSKESLSEYRDRTIDLLTACYSSDHLSIEQFESRVERAGVAGSAAELRTLLSDMPKQFQLPGEEGKQRGQSSGFLTSEPRNVTSVLSERKLEIDSTHSNAVVVLGSMKIYVPKLPQDAGVLYVQVAAVLSEVTIIVPNGISVDNRISPILSEMKDTASRAGHEGPLLRLDGFSLMSEVKVRAGLPE